jgi:hypothetical protein
LNIADDTMSKYAAELVALAPDVMLASSSAAVAPLLEATRTVPIVFAGIGDPVAGGYVESQARPGGNATGFTVYEYSIGGKWLELLKEVAPRVTRIAVLRDSTVAAGPGQFGAVQALAPSVGVDLRPIDVRDAGEIERAVTAFAESPNGGVVVFGSPGATIHPLYGLSANARSSQGFLSHSGGRDGVFNAGDGGHVACCGPHRVTYTAHRGVTPSRTANSTRLAFGSNRDDRPCVIRAYLRKLIRARRLGICKPLTVWKLQDRCAGVSSCQLTARPLVQAREPTTGIIVIYISIGLSCADAINNLSSLIEFKGYFGQAVQIAVWIGAHHQRDL